MRTRASHRAGRLSGIDTISSSTQYPRTQYPKLIVAIPGNGMIAVPIPTRRSCFWQATSRRCFAPAHAEGFDHVSDIARELRVARQLPFPAIP